MKLVRKILIMVLSFVMIVQVAATFYACSPDKIIKDESVVNIRVYKGGYGAEYIYALKEKFENAFADEGYKVQILTPSFDLHGNVALTELAQGNAATGVDLYMTAGVFIRNVEERGDYGLLVEDLTEEVWNKPAIKFDGTEEDVLIKDKVPTGILPYVTDQNGNMLGFNYMQSVGGMVVNIKKLAKYGITELPRTTDEMFNIFDKIYLGANGIPNSEQSTTFPITYVSGTNGYTTSFVETLFAQYEGLKGYKDYYALRDSEGNDMVANGYEKMKSQGLLEMLKVAYRTFDVRIAAYGSITQGVDQAQSKIMKDSDGAIFMCNGDWMFNEVKLNYKDNLHDIAFMNFPVISALGKLLFGADSEYILNDTDSDALLSYIIELVDERKTIDEIISLVKANNAIEIAKSDVERVAEARGIYYTRGVDAIAYVAKDALGKKPAMAFLRMFASDDFSPLFNNFTNGISAFAKYDEHALESEYDYINQVGRITTNPYVSLIRTQVTGFRQRLGLGGLLPSTYHLSTSIGAEGISMFNGKGDYKPAPNNTPAVYNNAAQIKWNNEYTYAVNNWSKWKEAAGITE